MGADSKIEWTDDTVNPWWGCQKVSPACEHCYAESLDGRWHGGAHWGPKADRMFRVEKALGELERASRRAAKEGRPRRVFIASMADIFEDRPDVAEARLRFLTAVRSHEGFRDNLRLLLLTKRPAVMAAWADAHGWEPWWWAGTTVEDQRRADERIPHLLRVPAAVRFLSCEPLLGPIDLMLEIDAPGYHAPLHDMLHWVIVGGESGHGARPMHPGWARNLRDQCGAVSVPFFWKQWGEWAPLGTAGQAAEDRAPARMVDLRGDHAGRGAVDMVRFGKKAAGRLLDGRTWDEVPRG